MNPRAVRSAVVAMLLAGLTACGQQGSGSLGEPVTIAIGAYPNSVAVAPDGRRAYVTCKNGVAVLDTGQNTVLGTIGLGNTNLNEIAITGDGRRAYIGGLQTIEMIELSTNLVGEPSTTLGFIGDLSPPADGRTMYLLTQSGGLEALDLTTGTARAIAPLSYVFPAMVATADGGRVYVVTGDPLGPSPVRVIDTATGAMREVPETSRANGLALSTDQRHLYTMRYNLGRGLEVVDIDLASDTIVRTIDLRGYSAGDEIAVSPDGKRLATLTPTEGLLTLFDLESGSLREQVDVGKFPSKVTFTPDGRRLYVIIQDGLVSVDVTG